MMTNLRDELAHEIKDRHNDRNVLGVSITVPNDYGDKTVCSFTLFDYTSEDRASLLNMVDYEYKDCRADGRTIEGCIWFTDGTCIERNHQDGAWLQCPIVPKMPSLLSGVHTYTEGLSQRKARRMRRARRVNRRKRRRTTPAATHDEASETSETSETTELAELAELAETAESSTTKRIAIDVTLLRHCESKFNADKQNDTPDVGLSERGIEQAKQLTGHFDIVLCSPMTRCLETLQHSSIEKGLTIICDLAREHRTDKCDFVYADEFDGAFETVDDLLIRIEHFKDSVRTWWSECYSGKPKRVLVVTHADFSWYLTSTVCTKDGVRYGTWLKNGEFEHVSTDIFKASGNTPKNMRLHMLWDVYHKPKSSESLDSSDFSESKSTSDDTHKKMSSLPFSRQQWPTSDLYSKSEAKDVSSAPTTGTEMAATTVTTDQARPVLLKTELGFVDQIEGLMTDAEYKDWMKAVRADSSFTSNMNKNTFALAFAFEVLFKKRLSDLNIDGEKVCEVLKQADGDIVCSGSFILQVLLGEHYDDSDIDFFVKGDLDEAAALSLIKDLFGDAPAQEVTIPMSYKVNDRKVLFCGKWTIGNAHINIIGYNTDGKTVADTIDDAFDLSFCKSRFDGHHLFVSPGTMQKVGTQDKRFRNTEQRIKKYEARGFSVSQMTLAEFDDDAKRDSSRWRRWALYGTGAALVAAAGFGLYHYFRKKGKQVQTGSASKHRCSNSNFMKDAEWPFS